MRQAFPRIRCEPAGDRDQRRHDADRRGSRTPVSHPASSSGDGVSPSTCTPRRRPGPTRRRGRRRGRTRTGRAARPAWARPESPRPARPPTAATSAARRRAPTAATRRCCAPAHGWPTAAVLRRRPLGDRRGVGIAAHLHVAARRQFQRPRSRTRWPVAPAPATAPAVIMPPGSRTRASAPSAARCTCSAPGQASWSRVRLTSSRYVARPLGGGLRCPIAG